MKKIMSVNAGSSSLKYKIFEMPSEKVITEGNVERIGLEDAIFSIKVNGEKIKEVLPIPTHKEAVEKVLFELINKGILKDIKEIAGVGHRIVQGGWYFADSCIADDDAVAKIEELCPLGPLHNPAHLIGIREFKKVLPDVPHVVVFDTAFHQTMPETSFMYAIPYDWYDEYKVRKYGAHGTSHRYVSYRAAEMLGKDVKDLKIVTCHIGNGASLAAVLNGKCVDTSMGLTPLEGIPMGTRSGNLDPTVLSFMADKKGYTLKELINILNKKSGYLGVSGISNDSRDLEEAVANGSERAKLALDLQYKRIADFIGSYYVLMGGIDVIVFTAGIGENSSRMRQNVIDRISVLGAKLDPEKNKVRGQEAVLSTDDSKIKVLLIPTEEELMIARDVVRVANINLD